MLARKEKQVLDLIDKSKDDNVALLQKLVQIPSFSGCEAEIGKFLFEEMRKFKQDEINIVQSMINRPNIIARLRGKQGKPSVTAYSHYDTVPIYDISKWKHGPFSGEIFDGKIYGRGSNDHKFPISAILYATKAIKDAGIKLKGDIVYAFVADEEFGGHVGFKYLVDQNLCDTDYLFYASGGGDGKELNLVANGRAYFRITVKGKTSHTLNVEKSLNAIYKATKLVFELQELAKDVNNRRGKFKTGDIEIEGKGRFSVNLIESWTGGNNVPDKCVLQIDRRLIPHHETFDGVQAEIQAVVDKLKKMDSDFDAEIEFVPDRWMNFGVALPNSLIVKSISRSVEKVLGFRPSITKSVVGGSSDHGWFKAKYPERQFVCYGASRGSASHGYDEYSSVDGLIDSTKIYALTFMDLLGVE